MKKITSLLGLIISVAVLVVLYDIFLTKTSVLHPLFASSSSEPVRTPPTTASVEEQHAISLSEQALRNIGVTDEAIQEVSVSIYDKTLSYPAMITERPGRTTLRVSSPFAGSVQRVYVEPGMVVKPDQPLFDMLLTHEELIKCQTDLIELCQKREILDQELQRLDSLAAEIAPKSKREVAFQKAELDAQVQNQRSVLRIHGIDAQQISEIIEGKREIIRSITIRVPNSDEEGVLPKGARNEHEHTPVLQVGQVLVDKGQLVGVGETLGQLVDLSLLMIEGKAFANDEGILGTALIEHCNVTAIFDGHQDSTEQIEHLRIKFIDTKIDPVSRTLRFFVELPNSVLEEDKAHSHRHPWVKDRKEEDEHGADGHYVNWKFRPGQRCELRVEYDTIPECIVLPREAVAESGNESFVFEWTGISPETKRKIWLKRPIHVLHRGKNLVAVANDGSIFPGAKVVARGAGQLLVALSSGSGQLQSACPCGDH